MRPFDPAIDFGARLAVSSAVVGYVSCRVRQALPMRLAISGQVASLVFLWFVLSGAVAEPNDRVGREDHTTSPSMGQVRANAPIPVEMHMRNEGGSDGAGLCVISSLRINGRFQGVPASDLDAMWSAAKERPGGYGPSKLEGLLNEVMPREKWASYVGTDPTILQRLSDMGYPIGATMNTGELYHWQPIHHMVSLVHFDRVGNLACVVDNNQPGVYSWMSAREYYRRWLDGGTGWAFVWIRRGLAHAPWIRPLALVVVGLVAFVATGRRASRPLLNHEVEAIDEW